MEKPKLNLLFALCFTAACLVFFTLPFTVCSSANDEKPSQADLVKRGSQVYKTRCVICHMPEGTSPNKRMRFADKEWKHGDKPEQVEEVVTNGVKGTAMMGFKGRLPAEDVKAVAAYVLDLSAHAKE